MIELWVGGQPLSTIGGWGDLTYGHNAEGGCGAASWQMSLPATSAHPLLVRGVLVEVKLGPWPVWSGSLTEPDVDDDWTFHAEGLVMLAGGGRSSKAGYLCLDSAGNTTSTPDVAIDQAFARGLPWKRPVSLSNVPFAATTSTDSLNYVGDLLDEWATANGKRWGVNASREVYAVSDPTVPKYHMTPGSGRFGLADDEYASDIFVRYFSGTANATRTVGDAAARARFGRREYGKDATSMGVITASAADAIGAGILAKGKARQGYTNGVEPSRWQLTLPGGQPATLPLVTAGEMVRMFGVLDEQGQPTPYLDWVIGETSYQAGADTIGLTPVGLVSRTMGDIIGDVA